MKHTTYLKLLVTLVLPVAAAALFTSAQAAPGDLDPTFGSDGTVLVVYPLALEITNAVAAQANGKIVLAGYISGTSGDNPDFDVSRLNSDGSFDESFGDAGTVNTDFGFADRAYAVLLQTDGKIIAAGSSDTFFALARYNADGSLDSSFGEFGDGRVRTAVSGGGAAQINGIALQSDGKIVVAGRAGDQAAHTLDFAILRYNADGTLDTSFGTGGGTNVDFFAGNDAAFALVIQANGKIVAGGSASRGDASSPDFALVRLNANGSLDNTFSGDGKVATDFSSSLDGIYGLALQADGKIVAAGYTYVTSEANDNFALARYKSDGTLDSSFGSGGKVITDIDPVTDEAHAVVVQADGHIIAGGIAGSPGDLDFALARYDSSGALDTGFGDAGIVTTFLTSKDDVINGLALQPDGKVVAAGVANGGNGLGVARYLTGGTATASNLLNISTRLNVLTGDNALIGGFIISGTDPKQVIVRAIGPTLGTLGVPDFLADPTLELHLPDGSVVTNDNWKDTQEAEIEGSGFAPANELESSILATLEPGAYTAIVRGAKGGTGVGLVEAYDLDAAAGSLANISTRGFVDTGDNVMIGGFIIGGGDSTVLVRGIGPSLIDFGVAGALQDPTLELHNGDGDTLAENDDWKDSQQTEIDATGLPPGDDRESAILSTLPPGAYTAILRGALDTTGVGLVEVYDLQ
ncbi:MAG: hypothetical protein H0W66_00315 [Chthoniobacterales bacterium]|nr:hypothetical protein [Chthoniobacterales bacterium]